MVDTEDPAELLFFDTFSHEDITDINLDLVQFPKPVFITQVRIIPLGARVQADFPGGVRLGATNPSKFDIEFFVNDLSISGASTFENLGQLQYNQNDCIHLECTEDKIPTDGLVLRGWYSTITLAVYGILTNAINEPIASPPPPQCETSMEPEEICADAITANTEEDGEEWKEPDDVAVAVHKTAPATSDYEHEDLDYPLTRKHYHAHGAEERERRLRKTSSSSERSLSPRAVRANHSDSNDDEYLRSRDKHARDWSRSPDYTRRARHKRSERSRSDADEAHKWPRTPPATIDSPTRPRSPDTMDYVDEEQAYKLKTRTYMRSNDSMPILPDEEEVPGTPEEQFEPILSDDEIMDDDDDETEEISSNIATTDETEQEILNAAAAAPPAIETFNPFSMPIEKFNADLQFQYSKEIENLRLLFKKFELQISAKTLTQFKEPTLSVEEREKFVYLSEQLIGQLAYLAQNYKRRNFVMRQFFNSDEQHLAQAFHLLEIALSFEAACLQPQQRPAFKIRHIKVGARLTELFACSAEFVQYMLKQSFDPLAALFELYHQEYMALSIKLMLLKAIYALLDTKVGLNYFLNGKVNGYQLILETLQQTPLTRTKYALQAIIKKLNLYEALECIRDNCTKLFVLADYNPADEQIEPYVLIEDAIEEVISALSINAYNYQQPKRLLPVSKKFEIINDAMAQRSFANAMQSFFAQHALAESLLLLLSNAHELPATLCLRSIDLLQTLLKTQIGVDYLVDDCFETTKMLVAILVGMDDMLTEPLQATTRIVKDEPNEVTTATEVKEESLPEVKLEATDPEKSSANPSPTPMNLKTERDSNATPISCEATSPQILNHLQQLAIELAYKVQTRYHLDAIVFNATSNDYDAISLATHLHAVYSLTCHTPGRHHAVELLGANNNMLIFMDLIKKEQRLQAQRQLTAPGAKYKSPVLSYAVDMVDCCVRYCEQLDYLNEHSAHILELAKNHDTFEPSVSAVLQEMYVYLKPLEVVNINAYDDITALVELINRSIEYITTFPGDLIMALRMLRHLSIAPKDHCQQQQTNDAEQLKYRFVCLQFYAADGVQILGQILERLCTYFEQPGLHTPSLMTIQGVYCCQIILPSLQVLREMLTYAIQCRGVEFKDLTAIDHLMKTYFLLHYYPDTSQAAHEVQLAKQEIIQTLLAYTQPNEQDEESLHKSLWTLMIREILKNIDGPATFIPGLQILSELLPLPLPMALPADAHLAKVQTQRLITERRLWSAHLHPQSTQIAKLIETIAPSSFPQLTELMTRVCTQLADLAPNLTLLISKTLSELLSNEWIASNGATTPHLARLLNFFARLTAQPALKSSALSILSGKLWDLLFVVLNIKEPDNVALRCQVHVHRLLENFLDSEISLVSPASKVMPALNLAAALPPKELIPRIAESILVNLFNVDITHEVSALCVRNLVILTEHDITFYHLALQLKQKASDVQNWLQKVITHNEAAAYNSNIESLVLLLRSLTQIEDVASQQSILPPRTLKLSAKELVHVIGASNASCTEKPNTMQRILSILEQQKASTSDALQNDCKQLQILCESLNSKDAGAEAEEEVCSSAEPQLPQAESIVAQYDARPMFTQYASTLAESKLSTRFWLASLNMDAYTSEDFSTQCERVACDLNELAADCLPNDTNLTSDCKRVLHLSASPQSNRERTPTAPCFRTRRVEVEPTTGRPEKKLYITPVRGRGFARAPPSRGDLFRSRPPNTSRPPSLHVDDFLALETCGAQPTGPTGYNKIPTHMRGTRVGRNRGSRIAAAAAYRKSKLMRTGSPSTWGEGPPPSHYRSGESHFGDPHYAVSSHFISRPRGRGGRARSSFMR